jgi:hypothetical protein
MLPTDNPVALSGIVTVIKKVAGPVFEFNAHSLFSAIGLLVRDAVGECRSYLVNSQAPSFRKIREEKYNT